MNIDVDSEWPTSCVLAVAHEPLAAVGCDTPVRRRSDLKAASSGPLIIEEYDSTCVIPPDARAELDAGGNIVIAL